MALKLSKSEFRRLNNKYKGLKKRFSRAKERLKEFKKEDAELRTLRVVPKAVVQEDTEARNTVNSAYQLYKPDMFRR